MERREQHPGDDAVYRRSPDFIFRRIADECIVIPVHQAVAQLETIYTLNEVGAYVWERLDGQATVGDLVTSVVGAFDVQPARARRDVQRFMRGLERAGAILREAVAGPQR